MFQNALKHVFASRIADIKKSPHWTRLSFVSCACNGLVVMDESLQLLPAVEILDLSRNKFSKVDNLRKCTKLKHLDLGFNHLREVKAFSEVIKEISKWPNISSSYCSGSTFFLHFCLMIVNSAD